MQKVSANIYYSFLKDSNLTITNISQVICDTSDLLQKKLCITNYIDYDKKHSLIFRGITEPKLVYVDGKPNQIIKYEVIFAIGFVLCDTIFEPRLLKTGEFKGTSYFFNKIFENRKIPTQNTLLKTNFSYQFLSNGVDSIKDSMCKNNLSFNKLDLPSILYIEPFEIHNLSENTDLKVKKLFVQFLKKDVQMAENLQSKIIKANDILDKTTKKLLNDQCVAEKQLSDFLSDKTVPIDLLKEILAENEKSLGLEKVNSKDDSDSDTEDYDPEESDDDDNFVLLKQNVKPKAKPLVKPSNMYEEDSDEEYERPKQKAKPKAIDMHDYDEEEESDD